MNILLYIFVKRLFMLNQQNYPITQSRTMYTYWKEHIISSDTEIIVPLNRIQSIQYIQAQSLH